MIYGVCAIPEDTPTLAEAGFDYVELDVQVFLKPGGDEAAFRPEFERIQTASLPCLAANCFMPAHLKITGPCVDPDALARYVKAACERAQRVGIETIVFGAGGARAIPDGFDRQRAQGQLLDFGQLLGATAERYGVTIAVEPLNRRETNVWNAAREGADYVRQVNHPHVRLLVDAYHWALEQDSVEDLVAVAPLICHTHIATYNARRAPGAEACDFTPFFQALKDGGYDGRISIECTWDDLPGQAAGALAALKRAARAVGFGTSNCKFAGVSR
jgi:sugar phosphate isomerase/epimerase